VSGLRVAVVGGSVAGLGVAVALARRGHRVTVFERDAAPLPATPADAFARWERRGSPQTRHSHAFLARLRLLLAQREPALLERLLANGAEELRFREMAARVLPGAVFEPSDDEIVMLACRRITFEWVLRGYAESLPGVDFRGGAAVAGLEGGPDPATGRPRATGVRLGRRGEERVAADLVVDASGRRTRIGRWLAELGARAPRVESEPCGIFYTSRFYRLRPGAEMPSLDGPMAADLGFLKYGIFPGDSRIFSITLAASPLDEPLRAVIRAPAFEALASFLPATRPWVDPAVAEPLGGVHTMAKLENTRRFPLEEGEPLALGVVCAGDSLIHTNPITGRGCTLALVGAFELADALDACPGDLRTFALDYESRVEREIAPWYRAMRQQDRDAVRVAELQRRGEDPFAVQRADGSVDPQATVRSLLRDGFLPALREDVSVLRAFMRLFNLLTPPDDLMKDPALLARVLAVYARRHERDPDALGPSRDAVMAQLAARAA
jgi:2-polyprenyl-6-methoxyphenol hydroxylase-like FAD-dependent oxidoreductase